LGDRKSVTTRPQLVFVELCKNFTFPKFERYFWRLELQSILEGLVTVVIVFAATSEACNEMTTQQIEP
jgi:hypothetical protein